MSNVQFGMLQKLRTQEFQGNQQAKSIQTELNSQLNIFDEAKNAYEKASTNDTEGSQGSNGAFTQPTMSVEELETKMNEEQEKLEKLMNALSQEADKKPDTSGENEDDKNKVKPKEFGGLMA